MRITVGGVLLFLGAGAVGAVAFLPKEMAPAGLDNYIASIREKVNTSLGLFHSASSSGTVGSVALVPEPVATPPVVPPVDVPPEAAVAPTPVIPVAPIVEEPKPVVKKRTRVRRRTKKKSAKKTTVVKKAPSAKATGAKAATAPKKAGASLIGSDVVLTLNTGREVKGVLQEQDAVGYKVELPGLGVFTYPLQNVKSIRAAE